MSLDVNFDIILDVLVYFVGVISSITEDPESKFDPVRKAPCVIVSTKNM